MGFFDNNQNFTGGSSYNMGMGADENGYSGSLKWNDPSNTSTDVYAPQSGAQGNELLMSMIRSWAQANGKDISHLGAFQGDPNDTEKYATNGQFDAARYQADMDQLNAFAKENFGDFVIGKTRVSGSDSKGGLWRNDILQRTADGYRPVSGATAAAGDTGYKSDGIKIGTIIAAFAGGLAAQGWGAGAAAGGEGAGAAAGASEVPNAIGYGTEGMAGYTNPLTGAAYPAGFGTAGYGASLDGGGGDAPGAHDGPIDSGTQAPTQTPQSAYDPNSFNPNGMPEGSSYASDFAGTPGSGAGSPTWAQTAASGGGFSQYIPAATQALNALIASRQSDKARDALIAGGNQANETQRYMFDTLNALQAPYRNTGYGALDRINGLLSNPSSVVNDPGYEWQRQQGQMGLERSAAARGLGLSGAALKQASRYNTDFATTKYNDVLNRNFTAAGLGQVANGQTQQAGINYANNVGNTQMGMGNALAANYLNQGNIYGNALNGIGAYYSRPGG